jgi:hypothetical protein
VDKCIELMILSPIQNICLPWTISENGTSLWLIDATYVKGIGSLWMIFCFIVRLLAPFGMFSLVVLGYLGSYIYK